VSAEDFTLSTDEDYERTTLSVNSVSLTAAIDIKAAFEENTSQLVAAKTLPDLQIDFSSTAAAGATVEGTVPDWKPGARTDDDRRAGDSSKNGYSASEDSKAEVPKPASAKADGAKPSIGTDASKSAGDRLERRSRPSESDIQLRPVEPDITSQRTAIVEQRLNDIFEPLREQLQQGKDIDPKAAEEAYEKARKVLLPILNETSKRLGIPDLPPEKLLFVPLKDANGLFNPRTGSITLSITASGLVSVGEHELQHKARALNMIAAERADPGAFRRAVIDTCVADIGRPGTVRLTDGLAEHRKLVANKEVADGLRALVVSEINTPAAQLRATGLVDVDANAKEAEIPKAILDHPYFGGDTNKVWNEVIKETKHFAIVMRNAKIPDSLYDKDSRSYIDTRIAELKGDPANPKPHPLDSPSFKKMIRSVSADVASLFAQTDRIPLRDYWFSSDEIASRKFEAAQELKRLNQELKERNDRTPLNEHPRGILLLAELESATRQQDIVRFYQSGDIEKARALAKQFLNRMSATPELFVEHIMYMGERGLLSSKDLINSPFNVSGNLAADRAAQRERAKAAAGAITISGENIKSEMMTKQGREYKLKIPVTVGAGTSSEARITAIILDGNGVILTRYTKPSGPGEFYSSEFAKEIANTGADPRARIKLLSDYLQRLQAEEAKGDRVRATGFVLKVPKNSETVKHDMNQSPGARSREADSINKGSAEPLSRQSVARTRVQGQNAGEPTRVSSGSTRLRESEANSNVIENARLQAQRATANEKPRVLHPKEAEVLRDALAKSGKDETQALKVVKQGETDAEVAAKIRRDLGQVAPDVLESMRIASGQNDRAPPRNRHNR
jgi:hypothetical protein